MKIRGKSRLAALLFALAIAPGADSVASPAKAVERAVVFADFEAGSDWRLGFRALSGGSGSATAGDLEIPPIPDSKRYLYVSFRAQAPTGLRVRPPEPILFSDYVRRFEFWMMGTGHPDEVFLDLEDATGKTHRAGAGRLDYIGWRKLTVTPPPNIRQRSPDGRMGIAFHGVFLNPAPRPVNGRFSLFSLRVYADHFMAFTRDHLRQPENPWGELKL
ncbi:MAG: hypothetical protein NXI24_16465 [bacterium]|nr:hypothetical protein [bacterium]